MFKIIKMRRRDDRETGKDDLIKIMKSQRNKRDHIIDEDGMGFAAGLAHDASDSDSNFLIENNKITKIVGMSDP